MVIFFFITGKEKHAEVWKGDNLFCSISKCSSLFSKIYDSSPACCLLDSAVIILLMFWNMCWGKILSELLNFSTRLKNCNCSLIPLLGLLSHFVGNPGGGTLIKFWKLNKEVRHISMSKTHPPERNMGVGLFEIYCHLLLRENVGKETFAYVCYEDTHLKRPG